MLAMLSIVQQNAPNIIRGLLRLTHSRLLWPKLLRLSPTHRQLLRPAHRQLLRLKLLRLLRPAYRQLLRLRLRLLRPATPNRLHRPTPPAASAGDTKSAASADTSNEPPKKKIALALA
jgi:hypothetical protein